MHDPSMDFDSGPEIDCEEKTWCLADTTGNDFYNVVDQQSKQGKISFIPPERYAADLEPTTRGDN